MLNAGNTLLLTDRREADAARAFAAALRLLPSLHSAACGLKDALEALRIRGEGRVAAAALMSMDGTRQRVMPWYGIDCRFQTGPHEERGAAVRIRTQVSAPTQTRAGVGLGGGLGWTQDEAAAVWRNVLGVAAKFVDSDAPCSCDMGDGAMHGGMGREWEERARMMYVELRFNETVKLISCCISRFLSHGESHGKAEEADREGERAIGPEIKRPSLSVVCVLVSSLVHLHDFDRDVEPREGNGRGYLAVLQSGLERLLLIAMAGTNGRDGVWEHGPGGVEDEVCVTPLVSLFSPFDESTLLALARHHFGRCVRSYVFGHILVAHFRDSAACALLSCTILTLVRLFHCGQ